MRASLACLSLAACLPAFALAADAEYEISRYSATITLIEDSPDVDVALDIVYLIQSGLKSDGYKYVGRYRPEIVQAFDEAGQAIPAGSRKERDYQVYWSFPAAGPGSKTVSVRFRLKNVLTGKRGGENRLDAPWLGQFRVPVRSSSVTFLFPPGTDPSVFSVKPLTLEQARLDGRVVLVAEESPLRHKGFGFRFSPGIADGASRFTGSSELVPFVVGGGVLAFLVLFALLRRSGRFTGGGSSGDSSSVGGCGGGCGGGGCGGGGCGG